MVNKKKRNLWFFIALLLLAVCLIQGAILFKLLVSDSPEGPQPEDVDSFSSFLNDKFYREQKDSRELFDRFFSDDFFTQRTDPFEEMEQMRRQMEKMMEGTVRDRFSDSWGG